MMDKNEYAERVEQMKPRLYRIAYLYVGSEAMALDAVYEAVYRGLVSVPKLREHAFFETWITRIVINECKKILRRSKREQPLETSPEMAEEDFDSLPLKDAIGKLPQELREIVILRYYSGFTVADTAEHLCIPQGTVATRQRRALQLLRLELTDEE